MKKFVITLISLYQKTFSPLFPRLIGVRQICRYSPTCSEYAKIHIARDGVVKGSAKSFLRILYCQPFAKKLPLMLQK